MLKVEIDRGQDGRTVGMCQVIGKEKQIIEETLDALGTIYAAIRGEFSTSYMMTFRAILTAAVLYPSSPVWTTRPAGGQKVVFRAPEERGREG